MHKIKENIQYTMSAVSFLFFAVAIGLSSSESSPIIQTESGPIQGRLVTMPNMCSSVYEFIGIPFAEPPIGDRRYAKTVSKIPWTETFKATKWPNFCPQVNLLDMVPELQNFTALTAMAPQGSMSEDCLYLNIWVPQKALDDLLSSDKQIKPLPTFTFIHGGGFTTGASSADIFNGTILASLGNIIVTTIQYRIGSLGFAYSPKNQIAGNMGLWDQVEALKWLCTNLKHFAGDCAKHTIGGESAGAASVSYHMLSPHSRPYFTQGIVESGTALSPWAIILDNKVAESKTELLIDSLDGGVCKNDTDKLTCARGVAVAGIPFADLMMGQYAFLPVIDADFLPEDPEKMLKAGNLYQAPLLIGANHDEGSSFMMMNPVVVTTLPMPPKVEDENGVVDKINMTQYEELLKGNFATMPSLILSALKLHYWPTKNTEAIPVGQDLLDAAIQAVGDHEITCPTYQWGYELAKKNSSVYFYRFTQRRAAFQWPEWMGITHGDELLYVFGNPIDPNFKDAGYSDDDKALSKEMMKLWTNFVTYGNPSAPCSESANQCHKQLKEQFYMPLANEDVNCPYKVAELSAATVVHKKGPSSTCGLKARDCLFWSELVPEMEKLLKNN